MEWKKTSNGGGGGGGGFEWFFDGRVIVYKRKWIMPVIFLAWESRWTFGSYTQTLPKFGRIENYILPEFQKREPQTSRWWQWYKSMK